MKIPILLLSCIYSAASYLALSLSNCNKKKTLSDVKLQHCAELQFNIVVIQRNLFFPSGIDFSGIWGLITELILNSHNDLCDLYICNRNLYLIFNRKGRIQTEDDTVMPACLHNVLENNPCD